MTAPTTAVRLETYARDEFRCVSCGVYHSLTFQHRRAVGAGGSKMAPVVEDGLTSCMRCNDSYEGAKHADALRFGWKVRRWVKNPELVPVFYWWARAWYVLDPEGGRTHITSAVALVTMREVYGDDYTFEKGLTP